MVLRGLALVIALAIVAGACGSSDSTGGFDVPETVATSEAAPTQLAVNDGEFEAGRAVFLSTCAGCHGADGSGSIKGRSLVDIAAEEPDPQAHITSVTYGRDKMRGFADKLSPEEIADVVEYIRASF